VQAVSTKRRGTEADGSPSKKRRLTNGAAANDDDEIEQVRRAASVDPSLLGADVFGGRSVGADLDFGDQTGIGMDDFELPIPEFGAADLDRARSRSLALSRLSTPAPVDGLALEEGEESYADLTCPIAMFDVRPQTQTQGTQPSQLVDTEPDPADGEGKGYSKNTVKALGIVRKELQQTPDEEEEDRMLSFRQVSQKASRRAAASFFFELLVLGTRDCVQITQSAPFGNIEVRAKAKLWESQGHAFVMA